MVTRRPAEEIARLGEDIYERDIRHEVEDAHDGAFVAIDVESGNWTLAQSELDAAKRLRERQPDAVNVWLLRVGYRAIASIGGGALRRSR
ncbi:MAG: hypothetical protein F4087_10410 [Gemmatimonadetes bacterium]|nr:hypothetical protein [Dehalococcoidia bacterium]MYA11028.1 hypothetical protein [Gemmatimonadota bacterium]MYD29577.1 hypothetical protein [Dehalococcoidia bacterium]MYE60846.1 hypothetical protein [Candidatus Dadabacteria bacterium]MYJ68905.1 hypothetical protein [Gemmatimonadota bacterium]